MVYNEIIIVTGYKCEAFEELTKDMEDVKLVYNPFYEMVNVLGSFYIGMPYLKEDFFYLHADTICDPEIFHRMLKAQGDVILPVDYKECDEEAMKVRSENGRIVQITKQMPCEMAEGEFIGIGFLEKTIQALQQKAKEVLKEKEFTSYFESAVQRLIDEKEYIVEAISTEKEFWAEIDFKEDYEKAVEEIPESLTSFAQVE